MNESTKSFIAKQEATKEEITDVCGCGSAIRYVVRRSDGVFVRACNKYRRCLTYEEQNDLIKNQNHLLQAYRIKRSVDGLNGRIFDAAKHFEAESLIEKYECVKPVED